LIGKTSLGFELRGENILSNQLGELMETAVAIRNEPGKFYSKSFNRNTSGLFLEHNILLGNFTATTGFLVDLNKDYENNAGFFPGIDLSYNLISSKIKLFASANRSLRLPKFTDLFYSDPGNKGNPALVPEELFAIEAGIESNRDFSSYSLSVFRDRGNNAIDWVWQSADNIYKAMNITRITTHGVEFSGELKFKTTSDYPFSPKKSGISYTYTGSEKGTGNYESKYALDYLKHKVRLYSDHYISRRIVLTCELLYQDRNGSYYDFDSSTNSKYLKSFKPYWLADTRINYSFDPLRIYFEVSNLFNRRYNDVGNLFQPGRWVSAGIQIVSKPSRRRSS
jgi:iron complex outermembrane receptor protein